MVVGVTDASPEKFHTFEKAITIFMNAGTEIELRRFFGRIIPVALVIYAGF
jgi:hypothetical protein